MENNIKKLIFGPPYPPILFTKEKNKTFRVTSGDRYEIGDLLSLCYPDNEEFAQATLWNKYKKRFQDLISLDWEGHERFSSPGEMYKQYSLWEGFEVTPRTELTILCYDTFNLTGKPRIEPVRLSSPPEEEDIPYFGCRTGSCG